MLGAASRPREQSLFGIAEKRAPTPLRCAAQGAYCMQRLQHPGSAIAHCMAVAQKRNPGPLHLFFCFRFGVRFRLSPHLTFT